jgi:histidinol-phosphate/aromatic aminotransferase/cobyric acid decarboxylase-like protein
VLLSRPNNPLGYVVSRRLVEDLAARLGPNHWLVIDEAFIDVSLADRLPVSESWVLVRSFTKVLAAPGLRLGYVATLDARVMEALESARQPWPVDSLTECTAARILRDRAVLAAYLARARELVAYGLQQLARGLRRLGLTVYPSRAPYMVVEHPGCSHPRLNRELARRGVYVRDASSFYGLGPSYSRVSVRLPHENRLLLEAFRGALESCRSPTS